MIILATLPFISDPQPLIFNDGVWHFYYLWNKDFPEGNGTEWRHVTSPDLEVWKDQGVAIPKYATPYGDPWSGDIVIDKENTAKLGKKTFIALCTMPGKDNTGQLVARWVSSDQGKTFHFDRIVIQHPAAETSSSVFRDPRILWLDEQRKWIIAMAETNKIGFYASDDLQQWNYLSGFSYSNLGVVECPCIFPINAYDENNKLIGNKWVLLCSANGFKNGFTTSSYYWTGSFDGKQFIADTTEGRWLDAGPDFYAAAISSSEKLSSKPKNFYYAMAWKNNWDYARQTTQVGYYGSHTRVRVLTLHRINNNLILFNTILLKDAPLNYRRFARSLLKQRTLQIRNLFAIPIGSQSTYLFISALSVKNGAWPQQFEVAFENKDKQIFKVIFHPLQGYITFYRIDNGFVPKPSTVWQAERNANLTFGSRVTLSWFITEKSVELIFNDGELSLTSLVLPTTQADNAKIRISDRECLLEGFGILPV